MFIVSEAGFGKIDILLLKSNSSKESELSPTCCLFDFISVRLFLLDLLDDSTLQLFT